MQTSSLFYKQEIDILDGKLYKIDEFLSANEAHKIFEILSKELNWRQELIFIFGKKIKQPRLQAWIGDKNYTYSGLKMRPMPWTNTLLELKKKCESVSKTTFNGVLANLYRNGSDYIGWHQDNELELGKNPIIASLSLGANRCFHLKHIKNKQKIIIDLNLGSLLIMAGDTQTNWKHTIPKTKKIIKKRINLTFRKIIS